MATYTSEERLRIVMLYNECGQNARATVRKFQSRYPGRRCPDHKAVLRFDKIYQLAGGVNPSKIPGRPRSATDPERVENLLAYVYAHPQASTKIIGQAAGISQSSVLRALHRHGFHPYHYSVHQELRVSDPPARLEFCNWALASLDEDMDFLSYIFWTDEATFTQDGVFNHRNSHYWSQQNPRALRIGNHQTRIKCNVWCGILHDSLIGPYFLDPILDGEGYLRFLRESIDSVIDDLPLAVRRNIWYQHDGAPVHNYRPANQWLNNTFPGKWIGRRGIIEWPARSPDLTPLDFFLWGHVKELVYSSEVTNLEDLKQHIRNACASINRDSLLSVQQSLIRRFQCCIALEGGHFEQFLH